jgi:uncharacterized membrane protein
LEDYFLARALHVAAVVLWIGGVAFVTAVLLPAVKRMREPAERVAFFERVEAGFARQARVTTLLTGLSGFYLVHTLGAWNRFADAHYWWMHAMVLVWGVFTLMLFVLEPLWLHRWFQARAQRDPEGTFSIITVMHWVLLAVSVITIAGAAAGSHGWSFGR